MEILVMPEIRMRAKHQLTLPAGIVREAQIQENDQLTVSYINGNIVITPKQASRDEGDIMSFAGIGRGLWGATSEEVDQTLRSMKNEWER